MSDGQQLKHVCFSATLCIKVRVCVCVCAHVRVRLQCVAARFFLTQLMKGGIEPYIRHVTQYTHTLTHTQPYTTFN